MSLRIYIHIYICIHVWWRILLFLLLEKEWSNCIWNSPVFSYLASDYEWRCLLCLSFPRWWKTVKNSCRSRVISTRSSSEPQFFQLLKPIPIPTSFLLFSLPPFVSICVYIYRLVCIYIYIYIHIYIYIYNVYIYIHIYLYKYQNIHLDSYVHIYVYIYT